MNCSISLVQILKSSDPKAEILSNCNIDRLQSEMSLSLLDQIIEVFPQIARFKIEDQLDLWYFEINVTDDEGIEFLITLPDLDLVAFLLEDDESYSKDIIKESFGIDSVFIDSYGKFLENSDKINILLNEIKYWEKDSDMHPMTYEHLKAVLEKGFDLAPFAGDKNTHVEFSLDTDEIFIGCIDDTDLTDRPDYHLAHEQFDPEHVEESIEMGIQTWADFDEEDSDWSDDFDDEFDIDEEFDDEWDMSDLDEEWDPGFDDDDL